MIHQVLTPALIGAETVLAFALFFVSYGLTKMRRQMAVEITKVKLTKTQKNPWGIYRIYDHEHPGSFLSRSYVFFSISNWLIALGLGAVGFCIGKLSSL